MSCQNLEFAKVIFDVPHHIDTRSSNSRKKKSWIFWAKQLHILWPFLKRNLANSYEIIFSGIIKIRIICTYLKKNICEGNINVLRSGWVFETDLWVAFSFYFANGMIFYFQTTGHETNLDSIYLKHKHATFKYDYICLSYVLLIISSVKFNVCITRMKRTNKTIPNKQKNCVRLSHLCEIQLNPWALQEQFKV